MQNEGLLHRTSPSFRISGQKYMHVHHMEDVQCCFIQELLSVSLCRDRGTYLACKQKIRHVLYQNSASEFLL